MSTFSGGQQGARAGAMVGAVGGLVFVLVNAGVTDAPWPLLLRVLGIVVFVITVGLVLRAPVIGAGQEPSPHALRAYWWIVLAEVVAIPVGSLLLTQGFGLQDAGLPWVSVVLGVHFLGFAHYFRGAGFLLLGATTTVLGLAGLVLTVADADVATVRLVSGVVTGFVLLASVLRGVLLGRRTRRLLGSAA